MTRSFECVVTGQYHSLGTHGTVPTLKTYTAKFILPSQEAALSVICKHLLNPYLRKHYPDFIRFRTHELVSITVHGRKPDPAVLQMGIEEMNIEELSDFCILRQIMIDPYKHSDLAQVKELIQERWREKRLAQKDMNESKDRAAKADEDFLRELNQLPKERGELEVNVNELKATQAAKNHGQPDSAVGVAHTPPEEALFPAEINADPLGDFVKND